MTRDEFAASYAKNSGYSIETLISCGLVFVECGCGEGMCRGWQSIVRDNPIPFNNGSAPSQDQMRQAIAWADDYLQEATRNANPNHQRS